MTFTGGNFSYGSQYFGGSGKYDKKEDDDKNEKEREPLPPLRTYTPEEINPRTGEPYRGTDFVDSVKETVGSTVSNINQQIDKIETPEILKPGIDLLEGAVELPVKTIFSSVTSGYDMLPANVKKNISTGSVALVDTLNKSTMGWSQQLDLHPALTETLFAGVEIAVTAGTSKAGKQFIKEGVEVLSKKNIPPTAGGLVPVSIFDGPVNMARDINLAEITAQPLKAVSGVNPQGTLRGSDYIEGLKTVIKSGPPTKDIQGFVKTGSKELIENKAQRIERYLNKGLSKHLNSKYKNTRQGYWNAKKLANDPELLNRVIQQHDEVNQLFKKYKELERAGASSSRLSDAQRKLYDAVGENFFNDDALIYGKHSLGDKARQKLVELTQWFSQDHWHHIFGNKEVGEFLLTEVAQDPLIAVNLFKHMKKRGLNSSGIAQNILIMKEKGHKNFHDFLRAIGIEGRFGRTPTAGIEDFGQEIAKVVRGEAQAAKTFTTEAGEVITKGTPYPADPGAVNHLFTLIDKYVEMNNFMKQKFKEGAITVMEPTGSKGLRKVVPNGYTPKKGETVFVYDLTANTRGKPQLPEIYSDKVGRVKKVLNTN